MRSLACFGTPFCLRAFLIYENRLGSVSLTDVFCPACVVVTEFVLHLEGDSILRKSDSEEMATSFG